MAPTQEALDPNDVAEYERLINLKRDLGLQDLYFFSKHIIETDEQRKKFIVEHVHKEWSRWYQRSKSRIKCILVPRGTFKSTFFTVNRTLQELAHPDKRKDAKILIANATLSVAQNFLSEVKSQIQGNETYRMLYGDLYTKDLKWTESEIDVIGKAPSNRYASVAAIGVGGNLVGVHSNLIICDDLVNLENSATRLQSEKVIDWWKRSLSVLDPDGEMIIIGTRWSYFELYAWLQEELVDQVDFFIRGAYNEDGSLYFPELLNEKTLADLKQSQGSYVFSSFYLNNPIDEDAAVIKKSQIRYWVKEAKEVRGNDRVLPKALNVFALCDPAVSQAAFADYSSIVVAGVDPNDDWYVLKVYRGKWTVGELIENLFMVRKDWDPITMTIETVGQSQALLEPIRREEEERHIHLPLLEIKARPMIKKEMRIRSILQPRFESGKVFIHRDMKDLEEELLKFPKSKHDDIIDPLTDLEQIGFPANPEQVTELFQGTQLEARVALSGKRHDFYDEVMGEDY